MGTPSPRELNTLRLRSPLEPSDPLEVGDDGDPSEIERVFALSPCNAPWVHGFLLDAGEGMLDGGPVPETGAPRGLVLIYPQRLQERYLGMDGERAPARCPVVQAARCTQA